MNEHDKSHFSYINPPPSIEEAKRKLIEVETGIVKVIADLATKAVSNFESVEGYDDWKYRANCAHGFMLSEKAFLKDWIDHAEAAERKKERIRAHTDREGNRRREIEVQKEKRCRLLLDLASDFLAKVTPYEPVFFDGNAPKTLPEARERWASLKKIHVEYERFYRTLRGESIRLEATSGTYTAARNSVSQSSRKIDAELSRINRFIAASTLEENKRRAQERLTAAAVKGPCFSGNHVDMIKYLLGMTERLRKEGKLTLDEKAEKKYLEILPLRDC